MAVPPPQLESWEKELRGMDAAQILVWAKATFGDGLVFADSLGAEDQVLTELICSQNLDIRGFVLDTGRLNPETYDLLMRTEARYGIRLQVFSPERQAVEHLVAKQGINGFRDSVEARKACCAVRKLEPLKRALAGAQAWVTGLRRSQSEARAAVAPLAWDEGNGIIKLCPLADWDDTKLWAFARERRVPLNPLHEQGYPSIGCAPCTRAVAPGEHPRAGRWWWEQEGHKECGLHRK